MRTMIFVKKKSGAFGAAKMINANDDFQLNFSEKPNGLPKEAADATMFRKTLFRNQKFLNLMKTTILHFDDRTSNEHVLLVPSRSQYGIQEKQSSELENADLKKKLKLIFEINFFASCI